MHNPATDPTPLDQPWRFDHTEQVRLEAYRGAIQAGFYSDWPEVTQRHQYVPLVCGDCAGPHDA